MALTGKLAAVDTAAAGGTELRLWLIAFDPELPRLLFFSFAAIFSIAAIGQPDKLVNKEFMISK